jgi:hypothetical protein
MRVIFILLVFASSSVYGQLQKGSFMIGGSMGITNSKAPAFNPDPRGRSTTSTTSVSFSPTVRYFFVDNFAAGVSLSITGSKSKMPIGDGSQTGIEAGPTLRYYFPFGKFAVFPTASATWGRSRVKNDYTASTGFPDSDSKWNSARYSGGAGLAWFIANNVSIEGILFYQYQDSGFSNTEPNEVKNIAFNVGIQFFIPAKGQSKE